MCIRGDVYVYKNIIKTIKMNNKMSNALTFKHDRYCILRKSRSVIEIVKWSTQRFAIKKAIVY